MAEYIDKALAQAELMMKAERWTIIHESGDFGPVKRSDDLIPVRSAMEIIRNIPSIDAVPVVHGKWELLKCWTGFETLYCSECNYETNMASNYCPFCGARMDDNETES